MRKTLFVTAILAAALPAFADSLDRVEVLGSKVRADVTRTCSALRTSLEENLGPSVLRHQTAGSFTVVFDLQGQQVSDVQLPGMPSEYRRPMRAALRDAACQDGSAQPQRFGFIVDVRMEDEPRASGGAPRFAMGLRPLN